MNSTTNKLKSPRSTQTENTKKAIKETKKAITNGEPWREALAKAEATESDPVQRAKIRKAIIDFIQEANT